MAQTEYAYIESHKYIRKRILFNACTPSDVEVAAFVERRRQNARCSFMPTGWGKRVNCQYCQHCCSPWPVLAGERWWRIWMLIAKHRCAPYEHKICILLFANRTSLFIRCRGHGVARTSIALPSSTGKRKTDHWWKIFEHSSTFHHAMAPTKNGAKVREQYFFFRFLLSVRPSRTQRTHTAHTRL